MSEHSLPEDLALWPDGPYELLGVAPGIAPKELKRSYTRLIRQYKPEAHPEHFRRIREAYEMVLRHLEYFGGLGIVISPAPPPADPGEAPDPAAGQAPLRESPNSDEPIRSTTGSDGAPASPPPDEPVEIQGC